MVKKIFTNTFSCILLCFLQFLATPAMAQADSVYWSFDAPAGTKIATSSSNILMPAAGCTADTGNVNGAANLNQVGLSTTTPSATFYPGASGDYNLAHRNNADPAFNSATNSFYTFTLIPAAGYAISLSGISFGHRGTATASRKYMISTSVAGFSTPVDSGSIPNTSAWLYMSNTMNVVSTGAGVPVTVRIYGYNSLGTGSTTVAVWRIDDVKIYYTVAPAATITTTAITGSPFCAGTAVSVPYTISGIYNAGNIFTAQLSDAAGSFATPVNIGTATSTAAGTISATIPAGTPAGTAYRIRVISSNPVVTGSDNGSNLTINIPLTPSVTIAVNPGNTICAGTPVTFTATPVNGGTPAYQWKKGTTLVGSNSPTYTDNALANGDVITVIMTSNAACASTTPVTSTGITMTVNPILIPTVTISANPGNTICAGTPVTFSATLTNGGTTPVYQWKKGTVTVGTNPTYTDNALANGDVITLTITSNATCGSITPVTSAGITMTVNPTLVPSVTIVANPGNTICVGTSVTFTATPVNGGTPNYQWKKGTTPVGTNSPTYTDNTLANGNVITVTMTSNATCASTTPVVSTGITMTVNPTLAPSVTITANPGNTICANTSVTFTATPTNGGSGPTYQWKKGTTAVGTNTPTYTDNALATGDVITVTLTSNAPCTSTTPITSTGITMTVNPTIVPTVTVAVNPGNVICAGTPVTFTATTTNGGTAPTYQWKKGATPVGTNSPTYTDNALANGDVITVAVTSNMACASATPSISPAIAMTVNPAVTPTVSIGANPGNTICAGTPVTFIATPVNGGSAPIYQWKKGTTVVGTNSPTYTDNALVNGDVITVTITGNAPCTSTAPVTSTAITITVTPSITPSITITANPGNSICGGTPVLFSSTTTNAGAAPLYQWRRNGITVGFGSTYTNTSLYNNDAIVCVLASSASCAINPVDTSNEIIMAVNYAVTPIVSISALPGTTITSGTMVTFTAGVTNGGTSPFYQWQKNNVNVGVNSPVYSSNSLANNDVITCTVTANSCPGSLGGTSNSLFMKISTGIGQVTGTANNLTLYPNPNTGTFTVRGTLATGKEAMLEVVSAIGQVVYQQTVALQNGALDAAISLPEGNASGVYLLRIRTKDAVDVLRFVMTR